MRKSCISSYVFACRLFTERGTYATEREDEEAREAEETEEEEVEKGGVEILSIGSGFE